MATLPTLEKSEQPERRAFVVIGMHRSGTSAMTRTLSLLGAKLPKGLMPPKADNNETGFWEPLSVYALNDEILLALDSEWDDVFSFRPRQYLSNFDRFYLGRAVELLGEEYGGADLIVLKDPRITILTRFWERALKEAGYSPQYVVMVRNPLEIAESLRERDGFPREKSLLLWASYMLSAERDTRDGHRIFIRYDQLMGDWRSVKGRIEADFGMPFPRDTATAANEIDRYLNRRMRHHSITSEELYTRPGVMEEVKSLYRIFAEASEGKAIDRTAVDAIEAELAKMDAAVGPLLSDYRARGRQLAKELAEVHANCSAATDRAGSLEDERSQLLQNIEEKQREAESLSERLALSHEEIDQKDRQLDELARRSAAAEAEYNRASAQMVEEMKEERDQLMMIGQQREQQLTEISARLEKLDAVMERERSARAADEAELRKLSDELKEASNGRATAEARVEDGHRKLARLLSELQEREREIASAQTEMDATVSRLSSSEDALRQTNREMLTLKRTTREQEISATTKDRQLHWLKLVNEALAASTPGWRGLLPPRWRRRRQLRVLQRRGLFDSAAYLERYPDVVEDGMDPLLHYIMYGMNEGRQADIKLD